MPRVTIAHLEAVLHAIECMDAAVEAGAEDPLFLEDARLASEARPWVQAEIRRREQRKLVRRAMSN